MRYLFEACVLDTDRRELGRGADAVTIAPQVFDLLEYLIRNRERVVSKDDLIAAIWGGRIVSDSALTTRLNIARSAIGDSGEEQRLIKTLPRKGFRFVGAVREEEARVRSTTGLPVEPPRLVLALPDKPSIAVLAFVNLSPDAAQEYLADGIVDDIITELSRFSELFVIARNSSFQYKGKATDVRQIGRDLGVRYLLEGSVRRGGDRIRIAAQLIDAATGAHRWAEHYEFKLEDVFVVQDEVVRTIVAILAVHIRRAETERMRAKAPNSWQAYDYYLQAADVMASFDASFSIEDLYETRRLLQQSLSIDPNYARSYALLANTYDAAWANALDGDFLNFGALDLAHQFARKAVQLDPSLHLAHASLGLALMFKHDHDASIAAFEKAIALNPNYVGWHFGAALVFAGEFRRAIEVLDAYMRLDPFHAPLGVLGWPIICSNSTREHYRSSATVSPGHRTSEPCMFGWLRPTLNWVSSMRLEWRSPRFCAYRPILQLPGQRGGSLRSSGPRTIDISSMGCARPGCQSNCRWP
jgi:TolB-like protein/Tfp pilus assembly protein PilF